MQELREQLKRAHACGLIQVTSSTGPRFRPGENDFATLLRYPGRYLESQLVRSTSCCVCCWEFAELCVFAPSKSSPVSVCGIAAD